MGFEPTLTPGLSRPDMPFSYSPEWYPAWESNPEALRPERSESANSSSRAWCPRRDSNPYSKRLGLIALPVSVLGLDWWVRKESNLRCFLRGVPGLQPGAVATEPLTRYQRALAEEDRFELSVVLPTAS